MENANQKTYCSCGKQIGDGESLCNKCQREVDELERKLQRDIDQNRETEEKEPWS